MIEFEGEVCVMKERNSFTGSIGFVLAAAGSAVGLGNIWRFPYLAAKDGGGLFIFLYVILALTFGFTLMTTEIAIGRKTKQSPLTAYGKLRKKWKPLGLIACLVPMIILPYYCAIGGWVLKYFVTFITGQNVAAAADGYFTGFITADYEPMVYMLLFLGMVAYIVIKGIEKGIESFSKFIMPILLILVVLIAGYSLTISHTDGNITRTGLDGLKILCIPNFEGITIKHFFSVLMDAMGQLFYSLSVAMGILIAYGSYVADEAHLPKSINQIELFDTGVAFLAGVMIIPAVYTFMGTEGMSSSGPGLMFVALPKVFASMGTIGRFIGILFFAMVFLAALTSAVSVMEAVVSSFIDGLKIDRKKASIVETVITIIGGIVVCLGYNKLYFELPLPNGAVGQILDVMDYISNNVFMPIVAIGTCILVGWILKPQTIIDEVEKSGCVMGRKKLYIVMIKYIAPFLLIVLFLKSVGILTII